MANLIVCSKCQTRLSLGEDFRGRRVRCPRCQQVVEVMPPGEDDPPLAEKAETVPQPRHPALIRPPALEGERFPDRSHDAKDDDSPRRKKRKSKKQRESTGKPAWVYLLFAAGSLITLAMLGVAVGLIIHFELAFDMVVIGIGLAIMTPISVVILIVSMLVSSALAGGIDFGQAHWAILKAAGLLLVVNVLQMIPFVGFWITLPVWVCGLMFLFGLDFWEARFLVIINWGLNMLVKLFLLGILISLFQGGKLPLDGGGDDDAMPSKEEQALMKAIDRVEELGGEIIEDDDGNVQTITFQGQPIKDEDLKVLKGISTLRTLNLSNTPVTDKGLEHLKEMKQLHLIFLGGTRVTAAGVKELQSALPNTAIQR